MFKTLPVHKNFLGIEKEFSSFEKSKVVILPIPYEATVSYGGGTAKGPDAILKASHYVELYDEETKREVHKELGIATLEYLKLSNIDSKAALGLIYNKCLRLLDENKFIISLGGEHTISQALIASFANKYKNLSVLQIDAHSDLRIEYNGDKLSHACVMARVCEFLSPEKIVQVGIRAQCKEEAEFIKNNKVNTFYAHDIRRGKFIKLGKGWQESVLKGLTEHVYVTFDVDGLDPSIMPSTGTPEPNGLYWDEVMKLFKLLGENKKVVGADVVEFAPIKWLHYPDLTAAKLVSKMINYFVK